MDDSSVIDTLIHTQDTLLAKLIAEQDFSSKLSLQNYQYEKKCLTLLEENALLKQSLIDKETIEYTQTQPSTPIYTPTPTQTYWSGFGLTPPRRALITLREERLNRG